MIVKIGGDSIVDNLWNGSIIKNFITYIIARTLNLRILQKHFGKSKLSTNSRKKIKN
jgi:hypothetical protein